MAVYLNDRFLQNEEAMLHVSDLSMQRGYAVFDFFRTVNGKPLFMADHIDRFYSSAAALHLPVRKSREALTALVQELIQQSGLSEAGIRLMLTGGYAADSYHPAEPNLVITCNPVKTATSDEFKKGVSVMTYEYQRELPQVKSINYLMAVWLQPLMKEKKVDDILYYKNNIITEFPRSNIFLVTKENKLVTPGHRILSGITRKHVLSLASALLPVEERDITIDELLNASEVFLTSTTKRILPVLKINEQMIGNGKPGSTTALLYDKLLALEHALV